MPCLVDGAKVRHSFSIHKRLIIKLLDTCTIWAKYQKTCRMNTQKERYSV